ncbi:hypothetical protein D3C85_1286750 [compost metagenome]
MADGRDPVRVADPGLQEIQPAPGLRAVVGAGPVRDAERIGAFHREQPLKRKVVNGHHTLDVMQARRAQQQGNQPRVPVVGVHQRGPQQAGKPRGHAHCRVREGGVTHAVVGMFATIFVGIDPGTVI